MDEVKKNFHTYLLQPITRLLNTFTSKVSNLLLSWEVEGAGGFKSYPTSEIPNKYIYDGFLMTYSPILLLLLFHFLTLQKTNQRLTKAVIL